MLKVGRGRGREHDCEAFETTDAAGRDGHSGVPLGGAPDEHLRTMRPEAAPPRFAPAMPPLAHPAASGLQVLAALRRNGFSAFPARCLDEPVVRLRLPGRRALVLASAPDAVRHVLQAHAED